MRDTVICTVGTSLIGNFAEGDSERVAGFLRDRNEKAIALELLNIGPDDRLCGAEINSMNGIVRKGIVEKRRLIKLLVSDTGDGRFIGGILKHYFKSGKNPIGFDEVEIAVVEGLTDQDVKRFKNEGLRNLVKCIGEMTKSFGADRILINATGGYKAQISFAGMIGQALGIPVCYLFERFSEVITLPAQPVSLDLTFWLDNVDTFFELEKGLEGEDLVEGRDERFKVLVEHVEDKGCIYQALSATGQLLHESFKNFFNQRKRSLLPVDSHVPPAMKAMRLEDKNSGKHKGLENYLSRINEIPYVQGVYTHYYNPELKRTNMFRKSSKGIQGQVEGWFSNSGALTKFDIMTTAETEQQLMAVIADLNSRFD